MDAITRNVLRMLEDDTMAAGESTAKLNDHLGEDELAETKDHPIGDVTGRRDAPTPTSGGIEQDSQGDKQRPPDAKPAVAHGMSSEEMLCCTPNAMGRMARISKGQGY